MKSLASELAAGMRPGQRTDLDRNTWVRAGEFFQLMRGLPSGEGRRAPAWLRLYQPARMDFAPAEVASVERIDGRFEDGADVLRIAVRHFGLFAPYGPLPIHITEQAQHEARETFEQFLGYLSAQLSWLDFRAWADLHPIVGLCASPEGNAFLRRVSTLGGAANRSNHAVDPHVGGCRAQFVGAYASRHRTPSRLSAIFRRYFGVAAQVHLRTGGWQRLSPTGKGRPAIGRWILGGRVLSPQSCIDIVVGPVDAAQMHQFRRGGDLARAMVAVSQDYTGCKIHTRLIVEVRTHTGMNGRVGAMRTGIDSWASPLEQLVRVTIHEPGGEGGRYE